ncbi:MAG TPA: L-2-hydroxyglutarate oxidase [Thermoanaerobaculia bacterium]|nr:L-2-hydroxyglutarate oxidase [Thermoanaerobaculia bacterium]
MGAGIVGLATAHELARRGWPVLVLEAENRVAAHQSGHNSGVIHSGLYYRPGSAKGRLCAEGREALYRLCTEEGIAHRRTGKLVVATGPEELPRLDELERRGRANGLEGLERLVMGELRERFPAAAGVAGLWVPQAGIVDFPGVGRLLARRVVEAGGAVRTGARVAAIGPDGIGPGDGFRLELATGETLGASFLVNCAGLQSDRVARLAGARPAVRIVPFRGEYFDLAPDAAARVTVPIYPVPDLRFPFLGVHLTPTLDGRVEIGPNAVLALHRHGYRRGDPLASSVTGDPRDLASTLGFPGFWRLARRHWRDGAGELRRSLSRRAFAREVRRLVPAIRSSDLHRGGCGIRAQAVDRQGNLLDDFHIVHAERQVHVLNAPSPAATAALAIGREIADRVEGRLA